MVINSPKSQSLKHAILGGFVNGALVSGHQLLFKEAINNALTSGGGQLLGTTINAFINFRIYNYVKNRLYDLGLHENYAKIGGATVSGFETFLVVWGLHNFVGSKDPVTIGITFGVLTAFFFPTVYEKKFLESGKKEVHRI